MTLNNKGGMYGKEGTYYANVPEGFGNYAWMELIGFDNEKEDFGVSDFIETTGFVPDGVLLLVTSLDIINLHAGFDTEYELDAYFCSYAGHEYNDERKRQRWTNVQLKNFVNVLAAHGIESYISVFDLMTSKGEEMYPELRATLWDQGKQEVLHHAYMTKRLLDGRFYEDVFLSSTIRFLKDYGFCGIHLADGICRPRLPLQWQDMSDDMIDQAKIFMPEGVDRSVYMMQNHRKEWISFCTKRWGSFLQKTICGLHDAGFKVAINSCWTKDPLEALYRYGIDYKMLPSLPIDFCVVENGAPTICLIDEDSNAGYKPTYEDRKMVHHSFRASLMLSGVCMQNLKLAPLYAVRDTLEQYDIIHHLPTALPKHSAAIFSSYEWQKEGLVPVIKGHTYCLSDGLSADNWRYLRLCADNAYVPEVKEVPGATLIWSDERNKNELEALIAHRTPSTHRLLTLLLRNGAAVYKTAHIEHLDMVNGDILVTNPHLLSKEEMAQIREYKYGRVIYFAAEEDTLDFSKEFNPVGIGFPYPLYYTDPSVEALLQCVNTINEGLCYISDNKAECRVQEIVTGEKTSRFIVTNDEYYYARPKVHTGRKIKSVTDITKVKGYQATVCDDTFKLLVPLMGVAIVEVEFE